MRTNDNPFARFGWFANLCAIGSLLMCYGAPAIIAGLALLGLQATDVISDIQAVLMWLLALLTNAGLVVDRKRHDRNEPLVLGIAGLIIMVGTLYLYYDWRILFLAYLCIISAIFLNQTFALKGLYLTVRSQAAELNDLNQSLEQRVADQVADIDRLSRLKRFLSPQVVELVTETGDESFLSSHRRYISVLFCDLRGFTAFSGQIEPEEAMNVLQSYHEEMGKLVSKYNGTIDHRAGDGLMLIFNDPLPCEDPVMRAVRLAMDMRDCADGLVSAWKKKGYDLGFGIGIASGYATLGIVGYEGRFDYTANGNAVNLASRLCDEARHGEIVISQSVHAEIADRIEATKNPDMELKGIEKAVTSYNVIGIN